MSNVMPFGDNVIDFSARLEAKRLKAISFTDALGAMMPLPSTAYVKSLEAEVIAERAATGTVSQELLDECERVIRRCMSAPL